MNVGGVPLDPDVGAQPLKLGDVGEAVVVDRVHDGARAAGHREERHELRLHVGGEPRIGRGRDGNRRGALGGPEPDRAFGDLDRGADRLELADQRAELRGIDAAGFDVPAGDRARDEKGSRLDAIRDHRRVRGVKRGHAAHDDARAAEPLDLRAHRAEEVPERLDLRLACRVLDHRLAGGGHGGHENVPRRSDARHVEGDRAAPQSGRAGDDVAVLDLDLRAQLLHAADMEIDRARAPGAPAGQRDAGFAVARQKRTEHVDRGAHRLHQLVGRVGVLGVPRIDAQFVQRLPAAHDAETREHLEHRRDILQVGHVREAVDPRREEGRGENRQRRVLRPSDLDAAGETPSALNPDFVHRQCLDRGVALALRMGFHASSPGRVPIKIRGFPAQSGRIRASVSRAPRAAKSPRTSSA